MFTNAILVYFLACTDHHLTVQQLRCTSTESDVCVTVTVPVPVAASRAASTLVSAVDSSVVVAGPSFVLMLRLVHKLPGTQKQALDYNPQGKRRQ